MAKDKVYDPWEASRGPIPKGMGHWMVRSGALQCDCRAATPGEARREALQQWPEALMGFSNPTETAVRLISGFPEIPGEELVFGETVLKGDCLPEANSPAYRVINSADDLALFLLDVPSQAVFVPPFRPHANSSGRWESPTLAESRRSASTAMLEAIGDDRRKGRNCE